MATDDLVIKLHLADDLEDDDEEELHSRRLVRFPGGLLLAFGGDDGIVTALKDDGRNEAVTVQRFDDPVRAVAVSCDGKRVAVGFETGCTEVHCFDDYDRRSGTPHPFGAAQPKASDDDLFSQELDVTTDSSNVFAGPSFDVPIRDLKFHPTDPNFLAVASEESACVVDVSSASKLDKRHLQRDAEKHHDNCGIRGVAFGVSLLCTLDMNGRLCVWSASDKFGLLHREATSCVPKKDIGVINGSDPCDQSCFPLLIKSLDGSAQYIVTPGQLQPNVRIVEGGKKLRTLDLPGSESDSGTNEGHIEPIVCMEWDASKSTLYTGGRDGRVVAWKLDGETIEFQSIFKEFKSKAPPVYLHIQDRDLYTVFADGKCTRFGLPGKVSEKKPEIQPKKAPAVTATAVDLQDSDDEGDHSEFPRTQFDTQLPLKPLPNKARSRIMEDDDDDDDDDEDSVADKPKEESVKPTDLNSHKPSSSENVQDFIADSASVHDDDSMDGTKVDGGKDAFDGLISNTAMDDSEDESDDEDDVQPVSLPSFLAPPQAAFAPSSTPLDLDRRYLCWNHMGSATLLRGDRNTIDISFTDSAANRPVSFTDTINFIIGSLGEDGGIFASDLHEDVDQADPEVDDVVGDLRMSEQTKAAVKRNLSGKPKPSTGSSVYFHRFDTFGSMREKDWYLTLPDGERVTGAACGKGWAAVSTSRRFLRMFSSGGNQTNVVWLKGEAVTMAGRSRFLAVIHHDGEPMRDGTQKLAYALYDAVEFRVVSKGPISCLTAGAGVTWVGFSNDFSLTVMDSAGMVSMLIPDGAERASFEWTPIADTTKSKKSPSDSFWPVTAHDGKLICVPLKGSPFPDATRRPVTTMIGMKLPFAQLTNAKRGALEELCARSSIALRQKKTAYSLGATEIANEDDFDHEYMTLCAQVDKVTLKLFATLVDAGKQEQAMDLVERLHLGKSFDLAVRLAGKYNRLAGLIEDERDRRFAGDESEEGDEYDSADDDGRYSSQQSSSRMVSPDMSFGKHKGAHSMDPNSVKRRRVQFD